MKVLVYLSILLVSFALASPNQTVLDFEQPGEAALDDDKLHFDDKVFLEQDGIVYELFSHPLFVKYKLRIKEPILCDPSVRQYSGYLDIATDKHLFFWFFESRNEPENAPLMLWLHGGPGCASTLGLLFEVGPCSITDNGKNVKYNPYSWNTHTNIIFLDQPINVGHSYSNRETVNNSPAAAQDVYAFLQLFLSRFPNYARAPFHLAGESYGGVYAPNIANVIHNKNKQIAVAPLSVPGNKHINLASVILGNGLTDPYIQFGSLADYLCEGPYAVYDPDAPACASLRRKQSLCQNRIKACYDSRSRFSCVSAELYCSAELFGILTKLDRSPYDLRRKCDAQKVLCYNQTEWVETWMNDPETKSALGANPTSTFKSCSESVRRGFAMQGDSVQNTASLLPELLDDGVRLLVYAGNADAFCNYMGNERWVENLPSKYHQEFSAAPSIPWNCSKTGVTAGLSRSAGGSDSAMGSLSFVTIFEGGHLVAYDQPEAALELIEHWIFNKPLH